KNDRRSRKDLLLALARARAAADRPLLPRLLVVRLARRALHAISGGEAPRRGRERRRRRTGREYSRAGDVPWTGRRLAAPAALAGGNARRPHRDPAPRRLRH